MFYLLSSLSRFSLFILMVLFILSFSETSLAQPGSLDATFGVNGKVITTLGTYTDRANAMAIQGDDKILMAGSKYSSFTNADFALVRYMSNGTLDPSFGQGGEVITPIESRSKAKSIAIQNDGKIVLGGGSKWFINLARYNTDGSLDTTFGDGGIVITDVLNHYSEVCNSMAIQNDGKILVGGYAADSGDDLRHFIVLRYLSNGTLDSSFGTNGVVIGSHGECHSIKILATGEIVLGGTDNFYFSVEKYDSNGLPDLSFGVNGKVLTEVETTAEGRSMVIQNDGKILLGGFSNAGTFNFALVRYQNNGLLDSNFGLLGVVTTSIGSKSKAYSIALQSDGKILLSGDSKIDSTVYHLTLARYNTDGTIDTGFGQDGKVITVIGDSFSTGRAIEIDNTGKIMVGGYVYNDSNIDMTLVRYNNTEDVGIEELPMPNNEISIYPNPFKTSTTLYSNTPLHNAVLTLLNTKGQIIQQVKHISGQEIQHLGHQLPNGVYYLKLTENTKIIAEDKLIIIKD